MTVDSHTVDSYEECAGCDLTGVGRDHADGGLGIVLSLKRRQGVQQGFECIVVFLVHDQLYLRESLIFEPGDALLPGAGFCS